MTMHWPIDAMMEPRPIPLGAFLSAILQRFALSACFVVLVKMCTWLRGLITVAGSHSRMQETTCSGHSSQALSILPNPINTPNAKPTISKS